MGTPGVQPKSLELSQVPEFSVLTAFVTVTALMLILTILKIYKSKKWRESVDNGQNSGILGLDDIPGDKPLFHIKYFGNLPSLLPLSTTINKIVDMAERHPGILKFTGANKTVVGLLSPALIQQLFKSTEFGHNVKDPTIYGLMKPFISNGLLVSAGKFWQGQRKLVMKTQSLPALKAYMEVVSRNCQDFVGELEELFGDGEPHEVNKNINALFLKIICEMIAGHTVKDREQLDRYHDNFQIWKNALAYRIFNPWFLFDPLWRLHPLSRKRDKAIQEMSDFAKERIREHRQRRRNQSQRGARGDSPTFKSLLDELLEADVSEEQTVDEVNTMIFGGHETGATAIHFFCFALALHPEIQKRCHAEVDDLFKNAEITPNGTIPYETAHTHLKYVERCLQETLRLFPPVFIILRQLETPLTLEHNHKTYLLPVGTVVAVAPIGTHRAAEHFPEPQKFLPDRFLPAAVAQRHPYSYLPFSGGQRGCVGLKFALLQMKVVAAYLLRNFEMTTTDTLETVPLLPYVTLTPAKDYSFRFKKRASQ